MNIYMYISPTTVSKLYAIKKIVNFNGTNTQGDASVCPVSGQMGYILYHSFQFLAGLIQISYDAFTMYQSYQ